MLQASVHRPSSSGDGIFQCSERSHDTLDPARVLAELRAKGAAVPTFAEVERRIVSWSQAQAIGASRDQEDPSGFDRMISAVSLDQPGLML